MLEKYVKLNLQQAKAGAVTLPATAVVGFSCIFRKFLVYIIKFL